MTRVAELFQSMDYGPAPESDAEARAWLAAHEATFGHFVAGKWTTPGKTFAVIDPSTNAPLAKVTQGTVSDVEAAVKAARGACGKWAKLTPHQRARHLYALARMVQKHARLFAVLESMDNGKPIRETRDLDIPLVARHFYHHAGWAQLLPTEFPGYGPVGVVGQIIPWNFPLLMLAWKVAPALAAGNTVVLKPAEFTPLSALLFAELAAQAGLPAGVLNIVTGDGATGAALVSHPGVDKIAFTGSTEVGKIIRKATAGSGKKLSLELGGKSPFIVYEDADLDAVVEGVVDAIWFNQGQVCCAGSRLLVQEGIHDRLIEKLRARMETLRVGRPLDKGIDMGAIVAPEQLERIRALCAQGEVEGATRYQATSAVPSTGCFFPPTRFTNVYPASTIAQVEIFGPVMVAMTFRTPEESVALANNTVYGLAASLWTENINLALDIAPKLKAGVVWVNATNLFDAAAGFGGYRESGFGREGGKEGMWEYLLPEGATRASEATVRRAREEKRATARAPETPREPVLSPIEQVDRTAKLFIGGKQARPDSGYSRAILDLKGRIVGEAGEGNRKDLRNAVEAAHAAAKGWATSTGHLRAQILYYIGENLSARADEFAARLRTMTGASGREATREVEQSIECCFAYAAWADKWDGAVHQVPFRGVAIAMQEPIGVVGVVAPSEPPLLGFVSMIAPLIATGNTVVAIPSEAHPLAATDLYTVFESSDLPGGVVNIVTGASEVLGQVLAEHDDVEAFWFMGTEAGRRTMELASAGNMKRTFCRITPRDGSVPDDMRALLREATQVKNIWVPYGA